RGLDVTSRSRLPIAPNIPTAAEQGLPDYSASTWYGLFAPAGTPAPVIDKLAKAMDEVVKDAKVLASFNKQGMITHSDIGTPAAFQDYFQKEIGKWKEVVVASGTPL